MSINILLNHLEVKSASILEHHRTEIKSSCKSELRTVIQIVSRAALDCLSSEQVSDDFIYQTAQNWLEKFKQAGVPIPVGYDILDSDLSKAFSYASCEYYDFPTFTNSIEEYIWTFGDLIIKAYYERQIKDFVEYCEDGGEYVR